MVKPNGHGGGILRLRWSFNFITKDPEIDVFRTVYQKQHLREDDLAALAGVATSTVKNMFGGKTVRPQHLTYAKLASAMHHEYRLTPSEGEFDYAKEIEKAKEERKIYRQKLRKKRERADRSKKRRAA